MDEDRSAPPPWPTRGPSAGGENPERDEDSATVGQVQRAAGIEIDPGFAPRRKRPRFTEPEQRSEHHHEKLGKRERGGAAQHERAGPGTAVPDRVRDGSTDGDDDRTADGTNTGEPCSGGRGDCQDEQAAKPEKR